MSQEKVDKKKYEKQHRKEIERKNKIAKITSVVGVSVLIIALIAAPIAISVINKNKAANANKTDPMLEEFMNSLSTYEATTEAGSDSTDDTEEATTEASDNDSEASEE